MGKYLKFYKQLSISCTDTKMMYSFNFWLFCMTDIINYIIQLVVLLLIYNRVESINGWGKYDVIIFIGTFFIVDSIAMVTFFFGIISIPERVRTGSLDLSITKPINTLFHVTFGKYEFTFFINVFIGIIVVVWAVVSSNHNYTLFNLVIYIGALCGMLVLYYCMMLIIYCISFWVVRIEGLQKVNDELLNFASKVPGSLYSGIWKKIFMMIIPYGLIATFPTQCFTSMITFKEVFIAVVIVILYVCIAMIIWKKGMKKYDSASS